MHLFSDPDIFIPFMAIAIVGGIAYLLPTIVGALRRRKDLGRIVIVNMLLGWTFIGWCVALLWSLGLDPFDYGARRPS
jgi:uncharacterized membrane protein YhaH (DUF805 family)